MDVRELTFKGSNEVQLYACGKCGRVHSPGIFACRSDLAHAEAQRFAGECCKPKVCVCGVELPVNAGYTACEKCREKNRVQKAQNIAPDDYNGSVYPDSNSGDWGEGYFSELSIVKEHCHGHDEIEPAYVFTCHEQPLRLDAENILENATSDMHEDAHEEVVDADEVHKFVKQWNSKQTCRSFYPNWTQVIILDKARFDALLNADRSEAA
ncbi:hypothetical protein PsAD5_00113 [Pseudovibrio sp. Ad5]|uniref:hypothetical protein n=1 Tax=Pseudovibrio sp. Ad5 TaxID=989436 RepID=UPI0007AE39A1|nr:hypothetical protein [Pseudovibrio sp. Ad5]KZL02164.1 hypothetical protein PsAD5_00113 [Pseudovibrio sp. Ad5]